MASSVMSEAQANYETEKLSEAPDSEWAKKPCEQIPAADTHEETRICTGDSLTLMSSTNGEQMQTTVAMESDQGYSEAETPLPSSREANQDQPVIDHYAQDHGTQPSFKEPYIEKTILESASRESHEASPHYIHAPVLDEDVVIDRSAQYQSSQPSTKAEAIKTVSESESHAASPLDKDYDVMENSAEFTETNAGTIAVSESDSHISSPPDEDAMMVHSTEESTTPAMKSVSASESQLPAPPYEDIAMEPSKESIKTIPVSESESLRTSPSPVDEDAIMDHSTKEATISESESKVLPPLDPLEVDTPLPSSEATKEINRPTLTDVPDDLPQKTDSNISLPSQLSVQVKKMIFTESQIAEAESGGLLSTDENMNSTSTNESERMDAEPALEKKMSNENSTETSTMLENLSSGKYVFKLSERERANKLFHLQFNCASNKYVRVSDLNWEINGWESVVFHSNNMFRKEEHDWQMVYLSREEGTQSASIEWRFDFRNDTRLLLDRVRLKATSWKKFTGAVSWTVKGSFPGSSPDVTVPFPIKAGEQAVALPKLKGCHMFSLRAQLSGGQGSVDWQHSQLFRTGLRDYIGCQFELLVHLKGETYTIEKVLHGKYFNGKLHYLVKWKGYSQKENTWEPEAHLNATMRKHLVEHPVRITGKRKR